jgi:hypothetical protein
MSASCTVIIGAVELLDALQQSIAVEGEVLTFGDNESLKALAAITRRRPGVVALERLFAATSRGAALINRIKADPALAGAEIRVIALDGTYRVSPRRAAAHRTEPAPSLQPVPPPVSIPPEVTVEAVPLPVEAPAGAQNLDYRGTRRAPRVRMAEGTEAQVDGALVRVVDLSTHGAQILCPTPLKPQQPLRMVLADDLGVVKFSAVVAWASYEIPKGVPRYRAGVEFKGAGTEAVDAFCKRHKS